MLHALVAAGSTREVWWLHGARHSAEDPFTTEAAGLLRRFPNSHAHVCLSAPLPTDRPGVDYSHRGRLSADFLTGLGLPADGECYVCGPASFMADVRTALVAAGIAADRVRTEAFGAGPGLTPGVVPADPRPVHQPAGAPGQGPAVTFARSRLTANWRQTDVSLLDLSEACDVPARWSCRTGVCHNCETALLSGDVFYQPEPLDPAATGNVLICWLPPATSSSTCSRRASGQAGAK